MERYPAPEAGANIKHRGWGDSSGRRRIQGEIQPLLKLMGVGQDYDSLRRSQIHDPLGQLARVLTNASCEPSGENAAPT